MEEDQTSNTIERYLNGELSPSEARQFEQEAEADPELKAPTQSALKSPGRSLSFWSQCSKTQFFQPI